MVTAYFAFQPLHSVCAEALCFAGFLWMAGLLGSVCMRSSSMACTSATRRNATAETNNSFSAKVSDVVWFILFIQTRDFIPWNFWCDKSCRVMTMAVKFLAKCRMQEYMDLFDTPSPHPTAAWHAFKACRCRPRGPRRLNKHTFDDG